MNKKFITIYSCFLLVKYIVLAGLLLTLLLSGCSQKNELTAQAVNVKPVEQELSSGTICNAYGAICTDSCNSIIIRGADCEKQLVCCK